VLEDCGGFGHRGSWDVSIWRLDIPASRSNFTCAYSCFVVE
jgi:hypothetical protein